MSDEVQIRRIKCPYCGWVRRMEIHVDAGKYTVVAGGPADWLTEIGKMIKDSMVDHELDEANSWVQTPPCPNPDPPCNQRFWYNLRTEGTKK